MKCICQSPGTLTSGLRGVLADGRRCTVCARFADDQTAHLFLRLNIALTGVLRYIDCSEQDGPQKWAYDLAINTLREAQGE